MSALILWFVFLFLGTVIVYVLVALDFAKKANPGQDNTCICENSEVGSIGRSMSNPYIVNPVVKTGAYAVPALKKVHHNKNKVEETSNNKLFNANNIEPCHLTINITLSENNKTSKRAIKKQKDYSLVNDVYYKAYNEAESMMTDYNTAKEITNNRADLATFEDGYHFDNYAEDFKQEKDSDNENY